ncbi:Hypothetical protein, putative [Bodo saltans]|uniref:Uncharacterized protein n=1 Tax=Bodo saltans TaxID=75058 RepID=A0A0S4KIR3_BODSA|nr:Hypothetical protein, putative [Bodo saltans]|eukprot:CUI14423.1 Hypothetical protein, putative [Bodo saltans]
MAPKKKQEDTSDRPPEGDDERLLTISFSALIARTVLFKNKSPMFVVQLSSAPEDTVKVEVPADLVAQCTEGSLSEAPIALQMTLFSKKIVLTPLFVDNVLAGRVVVSLLCIPEAKDVPVVVTGKGAKPAAPAKGKGAISSVVDMPLEELTLLNTFSFDLCPLFGKTEWSTPVSLLAPPSALNGLFDGVVKVTSSDALLAASNMAKYMPLVIEVTRVNNLPNDGPLDMEHNGLRTSTLPNNNNNTDHSAAADQGTVFVDYTFLGEYVRTQDLPRTSDVVFAHRKAFFLSKFSPVEVYQKLFYPFEFQVHDQQQRGSKLKPSFGVATASVRTAITEKVKLFALSSQLVPGRDGSEGTIPPPDYLSFSTTLKTKIEFFVSPLQPKFVNPASALDAAPVGGASLSRVLLTMPYLSSFIPAALQAIMGTLVTMPKGGVESAVKEYEPAPPEGSDRKKGNSPPPGASPSGDGKPFRLVVPPGVSGFEVIDDKHRILCFEGPLPLVHHLAEVATSVVGDDPSCSVLINSELPFPQRAYHAWPSLVLPMEDPKAAPKEVVATPEVGSKPGAAAASGKKAAAGKKKVQEQDIPKPVSPEMADAPPEIDAGGVGGRIRRIRLGTVIEKLATTQRNFIKRTLPIDALTCITKLGALRTSRSILHAVDMNLFPTARELIALERIHGQTLELIDVCGTDHFVSFSDADVGNIVKQAQLEAQQQDNSPVREIDVTSLSQQDIGSVVSFVGVPASEQQRKGLEMDPVIFGKFKSKAFVFLLEQQCTIRCAFASSQPPTQMLRHAFTAQVVRSGDTPVLLVLDFQSLAKKSSDHLNPSFDTKIRRDKRRAPPSEYFSQLAARRRHYTATHQKSGQEGQAYRDYSSDDDDGFIDGPPGVDRGLELNELRANYVVLNKSIAPGPSLEESMPDYDLAKALFEKQGRRIANSETLAEVASHSQPFRTVAPMTGEESRKHPQAPSQQRIDDLHQPWEAPQGYKGTKTGNNPFRFSGARSVLDDPERGKSLLSGMTAQEKRQQEREQKEVAVDQWKSKVVVDDTNFRVRCQMPSDAPVSQLDKLQTVLDGAPTKASLRKTYVPSAPPSMFTYEIPPPLRRVERNVTKHPETQRFYYSKEHKDKHSISAVEERERHSPLYYPKKEQ